MTIEYQNALAEVDMILKIMQKETAGTSSSGKEGPGPAVFVWGE